MSRSAHATIQWGEASADTSPPRFTKDTVVLLIDSLDCIEYACKSLRTALTPLLHLESDSQIPDADEHRRAIQTALPGSGISDAS